MSWLLLGAELPMFPATLRAASAAVPRVRGIGTQVLQCRLQKRVRIIFVFPKQTPKQSDVFC